MWSGIVGVLGRLTGWEECWMGGGGLDLGY